MPKSNQPSSKQLKQTLNRSLINPREPGPMQMILEVNDPRYYQQRAMELIRDNLQKHNPENLIRAVTLLALANLPKEPIMAKLHPASRSWVLETTLTSEDIQQLKEKWPNYPTGFFLFKLVKNTWQRKIREGVWFPYKYLPASDQQAVAEAFAGGATSLADWNYMRLRGEWKRESPQA